MRSPNTEATPAPQSHSAKEDHLNSQFTQICSDLAKHYAPVQLPAINHLQTLLSLDMITCEQFVTALTTKDNKGWAPIGLFIYLIGKDEHGKYQRMLELIKECNGTQAQIVRLLTAKDSDGWAPVHFIGKHLLKYLKYTLHCLGDEASTALRQQTNKGTTPLHIIAQHQPQQLKLALTLLGDDALTALQQKRRDDWTPAHLIAACHPQYLELLLGSLGDDAHIALTQKNNKGKTPIDLLKKGKNTGLLNNPIIRYARLLQANDHTEFNKALSEYKDDTTALSQPQKIALLKKYSGLREEHGTTAADIAAAIGLNNSISKASKQALVKDAITAIEEGETTIHSGHHLANCGTVAILLKFCGITSVEPKGFAEQKASTIGCGDVALTTITPSTQ